MSQTRSSHLPALIAAVCLCLAFVLWTARAARRSFAVSSVNAAPRNSHIVPEKSRTGDAWLSPLLRETTKHNAPVPFDPARGEADEGQGGEGGDGDAEMDARVLRDRPLDLVRGDRDLHDG